MTLVFQDLSTGFWNTKQGNEPYDIFAYGGSEYRGAYFKSESSFW